MQQIEQSANNAIILDFYQLIKLYVFRIVVKILVINLD